MNETTESKDIADAHVQIEESSTHPIVEAYNEVAYVDNAAVYAARLAKLAGFVVTTDNIDAAKKTRAALNGLAKDASAARMTVQRAIKAHPIGIFAFNKSELEKQIEKESKRLDSDIKHAENAPKIQLNEKVETFVCFITGTLAQINKLAVYVNEEMGLAFENRGPVDNGGDAVDAVVEKEVRGLDANTPPPPPPPADTTDPIF